MKRTIKIALGLIKYFVKTAQTRLSELKSEYENIVLSIDNNKSNWHTMDKKPDKPGTILFYLQPNKPDCHYFTIRTVDEIQKGEKSWDSLLRLGSKYWAYCDELFNI